ncbi:proline-rich receptor-like protein kinase PERK9 [Mercurialis annua]|uniref:proline-rich receptor-like protein kinase PERK9 n=1 Tax=Mercurialis annua TaxID=3986 RepID=UPI00215F508C|nr:proline-rich receptor-like protein kinase PERK9 [Mercurialis annua]
MSVDESFKKPGSVPFKWEIRPGVPKTQLQKQLTPPALPSPSLPFNRRHPPSSPSPLPITQPQQKLKLKPPPAGFIFIPPVEPRTCSFQSAPRSRSERWWFDQPARVSPECVSHGCLPSPLLKRKGSKRRTRTRPPEPDYVSDLETKARWSLSSRKSLSPFHDSSMSSNSSSQSSPRPVSDAEWAGFGLF